MDLRLAGKVAVVTGGSRGIGRAIAERLLDEGMGVAIASLRPASVEAAARGLEPRGRVIGLPADVASEEDVARLVRETVRRLGRLDLMVANAGIVGPETNLIDMGTEQWDRTIAVHLRGAFLCGREAARAMREAGVPGRIVTVASTSAFQADAGSGDYNAAKSGMIGLTRSMAVDFAPWGIRVNAVAPGWVRTDMTRADLPERGVPMPELGPLARAGEPEEVAAAVAFLASPLCDFVTGATLLIDGGQTAAAPRPGG